MNVPLYVSLIQKPKPTHRRKLRSTGFSDDDISVLFPDKEPLEISLTRKKPKMPEGSTVGANTGGAGGTIA